MNKNHIILLTLVMMIVAVVFPSKILIPQIPMEDFDPSIAREFGSEPFEVHVEHYLGSTKEFLLLIPGMIAMAALFVFRPEKFRALPYIVLAVMGVYLAYSTFGKSGWRDHIYGGDCMTHYSSDSVFCSAVPIVVLLVLQIVRAVQKKKQNT